MDGVLRAAPGRAATVSSADRALHAGRRDASRRRRAREGRSRKGVLPRRPGRRRDPGDRAGRRPRSDVRHPGRGNARTYGWPARSACALSEGSRTAATASSARTPTGPSPFCESLSVSDGATATLVRQARSIDFGSLPDEVIVVAKTCILDWLGCALAGSREPLSDILVTEAANHG